MADFYVEKRVVVSPDPAHLTASVAKRFLSKVAKRTRAGEVTHVLLTGGTTSLGVLRAAAERSHRHSIDWSLVHVWWSDERFVDSSSDERNEKQARETLLSSLTIPGENIHAIAAADSGLTLDEAAAAYTAELAAFGAEESPWPRFDICFLGVGSDAHIASLFPDRREIHLTEPAAVAVRDSPKLPSERVTLIRPVINSSQRVWLIMTGVDKASALGLALAGASYASVPAAGAKGRKRTVFFVDEAAAAQVPPELIDGEY